MNNRNIRRLSAYNVVLGVDTNHLLPGCLHCHGFVCHRSHHGCAFVLPWMLHDKTTKREVHPCQWEEQTMLVLPSWKWSRRQCVSQNVVHTSEALRHWRRANWCYNALVESDVPSMFSEYIDGGHFAPGEDEFHRRVELGGFGAGRTPSSRNCKRTAAGDIAMWPIQV